MYKNEFDKEFQKHTHYNGYLFYGADPYLVESYGEMVAKSLTEEGELQKLYFEDFTVENAQEILSQNSLFSSTNILLCKIAKKIGKKELDSLLATSVANQSTLILSCFGDGDFKSMEGSFTKKTNSVSVRFFQPEPYEALAILRAKSDEFGVNIAHTDLEYLYTMHQKDLGLCVSDLKKLAILEEPISAKTISLQCFGLGSVDIESFMENLILGKNINKELYDLLEEGINEIALINRITSYIQMLFMVNSYLKLYGTLNILEIWGYPLPQKVAARHAEVAKRFQKNDFEAMLQFFCELELELKSGKVIQGNGYFQSKIRIFLKGALKQYS